MFHLVGDVHQPLHTSTLFTVVFPEGDRGGTRFYIAEAENERTKHLHSFWDGLVRSSQKFSSVRNRARGLLNRNDLQRQDFSELTETTFEGWAKESLALAKKDGYLMGQLEGSPDELDGAVLPDDYKSRSEPIAIKRAVLAGYRLADLLEIMLTTIAAYGSFILAERIHVSPVIAVLLTGMIVGNYGRRQGMSPNTEVAVDRSGSTQLSWSTRWYFFSLALKFSSRCWPITRCSSSGRLWR